MLLSMLKLRLRLKSRSSSWLTTGLSSVSAVKASKSGGASYLDSMAFDDDDGCTDKDDDEDEYPPVENRICGEGDGEGEGARYRVKI